MRKMKRVLYKRIIIYANSSFHVCTNHPSSSKEKGKSKNLWNFSFCYSVLKIVLT